MGFAFEALAAAIMYLSSSEHWDDYRQDYVGIVMGDMIAELDEAGGIINAKDDGRFNY